MQMKKARMNISHSHFILFKLKIFGEIVTTFFFTHLGKIDLATTNQVTKIRIIT